MGKTHKNSSFGRGGTFECASCGRRTRETGTGIDHVCHECYELGGLDNMVNDNGEYPAWAKAEAEALVAAAVKKGSDPVRIKAGLEFLFPKTGTP